MQNNANLRNFKIDHGTALELTPSDILAPFIRKEIRIPESGKFFLVESRIYKFFSYGTCNPGLWKPEYRVQGIKISIKTGIRNPSSTDEKSGILGTWNQEATAWDP